MKHIFKITTIATLAATILVGCAPITAEKQREIDEKLGINRPRGVGNLGGLITNPAWEKEQRAKEAEQKNAAIGELNRKGVEALRKRWTEEFPSVAICQHVTESRQANEGGPWMINSFFPENVAPVKMRVSSRAPAAGFFRVGEPWTVTEATLPLDLVYAVTRYQRVRKCELLVTDIPTTLISWLHSQVLEGKYKPDDVMCALETFYEKKNSVFEEAVNNYLNYYCMR